MIGPVVANFLIGLSLVPISVVAAEVSCWAPDGKTRADNETYVPCNKLGIQSDGIYSSCCRLDGKASERDLCAASGLCLNDGVLFRGYCTDKNWDSPACINVCTDEKNGGSMNETVEITPCTDGKYCCGHNNLACCGTKEAFEIPTQASVIADDLRETETVNPNPHAVSGSFKDATIALAVLFAVAALAGIGVTIWLMRKNKGLNSQLEQAKAAENQPDMAEQQTPSAAYRDPYQQDPDADASTEYTGMSSPRQHWTPYKAPLSPHASMPEADGNPQRYSELDATVESSERAYGGPASPEPHQYQYQQQPTIEESPVVGTGQQQHHPDTPHSPPQY